MNDIIEKYLPQTLGENQGTCTMYVLAFPPHDCMILLPKKKHEGSMPGSRSQDTVQTLIP